MLRVLAIRDYVIFEHAEIEAGRGFCVLTGETGAGKSLLVDALELLVGGRADPAIVREGAERAELSAEFGIPARGALPEYLAAHGLEGDPGTLILRRSVERGGRSRSFINGHAATLAQAREAGEWLVDIHGQHAHQSLLRAPAQRELLDAHGGLSALVAECAAAYRTWKELAKRADEAQAHFERNELQRRELAADCAELARLAPAAGEWEAVAAEHARLAHGSSLLSGAQSALEILAESEPACIAQLTAVAGRLRALSSHDAALAPVVELLDSAGTQAEEAARALRNYASRVDLDPAALGRAQARIEALHSAARRYRVPPAELHAHAAGLRARLAELESAVDPQALARETAGARARFDTLAGNLSRKRRSAAAALSKSVTAAMQTLAMAGGRFAVALHPLAETAAHGKEDVEFQVASHESLTPRPLGKVASGGELSRISLAIQLVAAKSSPVATLLFDEIDSGIGGAVAEIVGKSLARLGRERQVLCVTHLPQVAAQGAEQWVVHKESVRGGIACRVRRLEAADRIEELARMLGGTSITATTRRHATEMLEGR